MVFVGCGGVVDIERCIDSYINGGGDDNLDATLYVIDKGEVWRCGQNEDNGFWRNKCDVSRAEGSGCDFALAALDFGKSAKEAVKYASTRDVYTGGKIRVVKVNT